MADDAYPLPGVTTVTTIGQWENLFAQLGDGVLGGLAPSLNSGTRQAVIGTGAALLRGFYKPITASTGVAIPAASAQNRIDRLVLRIDRTASTSAAFVQPVVITGTPSATPAIPALTRTTTGQWDLPICRWTSASTGALSSLVDERAALAGGVLSFPSTARPATGLLGQIGRESDTGRYVGWTGSAWAGLIDDSGDASITLESSWASSGPNLARKVGGVVNVDLSIAASISSVIPKSVVNSSGEQLANVPAAFRPSRLKYFAVVMPNGSQARLQVETTGEIVMWHVTADITNGTSLKATLTYIP